MLPPLLIRSAQELIPDLRTEHIEISKKVGIRSQLFNRHRFLDAAVHIFMAVYLYFPTIAWLVATYDFTSRAIDSVRKHFKDKQAQL